MKPNDDINDSRISRIESNGDLLARWVADESVKLDRFSTWFAVSVIVISVELVLVTVSVSQNFQLIRSLESKLQALESPRSQQTPGTTAQRQGPKTLHGVAYAPTQAGQLPIAVDAMTVRTQQTLSAVPTSELSRTTQQTPVSGVQ